ncbi:putative HD superfamily hydrolase of NAD metabolism [Marinitoga hydrogenitolerans DSM 16785]|uniref:bis(5'-nucleosyl)-tetraphosphatase (symmetrical) n=1 Tax=Marinitoga hydrogenitolerans (strain DSM 16785 / JCM 12826 / AT1271) TaxID=1122195 RepID=A0A1M4X234_MARH1|nr:bis(5'-nucleosyl)-tetraphosphatase (symmetrical) YqeK [Marinitoga hydrogenitolerans]SHE87252.1 putative HD superfamily hydrolase of NAD metabolism [Marinitoga hydrogenitolerans DSM 16785]
MEEVIEEIKRILKKMISEYRLKHIMGVTYTAKILADKYGVEENRIELAALGHDLFRDVKPYKFLKIAKVYEIGISYVEKKNPILLHGKIAAEYLKREYNIPEDVYEAIYYHTSGYKHFGIVGKIIFIADSIEPTRKYKNVEYYRDIAFYDINRAYKEILKNKVIYSLERNHFLLSDTVDAWNYSIAQ